MLRDNHRKKFHSSAVYYQTLRCKIVFYCVHPCEVAVVLAMACFSFLLLSF